MQPAPKPKPSRLSSRRRGALDQLDLHEKPVPSATATTLSESSGMLDDLVRQYLSLPDFELLARVSATDVKAKAKDDLVVG